MDIVSQAQARFLGAAAAGKTRSSGPTPAKARQMLAENRGMKMSRLPVRAPQRAGRR